jgi:hypothetical protein
MKYISKIGSVLIPLSTLMENNRTAKYKKTLLFLKQMVFILDMDIIFSLIL